MMIRVGVMRRVLNLALNKNIYVFYMNINYILIGLITLIIGFHIFNSSAKESITNLNVKDLSIKKNNGKFWGTYQ